ncbi:MAG: class I SAM-dependent methyltransferase [Bryobacteraceae bacterium]|jgi:SAM-dependent methyltransferase
MSRIDTGRPTEAGWRGLGPVQGAFDLAGAVAHNQAQITGSGPVSIVTDPGQWWYAAAFRLQPAALQSRPADEPLSIRVEATVQAGRIGALFVADDLQKVLGAPAEKTPADGDATLEVVVNPAPSSGWLILRNNAPAGKASRCEVRAIQAFQTTLAEDSGLTKMDAEASDDQVLDVLRRKWSEVPAGLSERCSTTDLAGISDQELWSLWARIREETTTGDGYSMRGWYHDLYRDMLRGKRVLDVGSGLGIDGLSFALAGAHVTFLDIAQSNLQIVERLCRIGQASHVRFHYLEDLSSLDDLPDDFDVVWCQGSMINAPFSFARSEAEALLRRLPVGGRWIELAYPRERWEREGRLPFHEWGKKTDGESTPWMEWYDLERLRARLHPAEFDVVLHFNFHQDDFNWFDLIRRK